MNANGGAMSEAAMPDSPRGRRRWLTRGLAVGLALLPFIALEVVLHVAGLGCRTDAEDPFVTLTSAEPLFVLSSGGDRYEIPTTRHVFFRHDSFPARKPADSFRVFCLGGSTVQGRPYSTETAFPKWLELSLSAAEPDVHWRVINCGGISYASYRLVPILTEVLEHEPDLIVICTGHNEFLEQRTYRHLGRRAGTRWTPISMLGQLHCYRLGRGFWLSCDKAGARVVSDPREWTLRDQSSQGYDSARERRSRVFRPAQTGNVSPGESLQRAKGEGKGAPEARTALPGEVDALLDHGYGYSRYSRDDERARHIIEHFEQSLTRMLRLARRQRVPVVLLAPPSNLKDCPPFKSEHGSGLTRRQREQFTELCDAADALPWSELHRKIALLEQAVAIDPRHAGAQFRLGKCYEVARLPDKALSAFVRAKDEDVCPLRMLESMRATMGRVAEATGTTFIDVHARFAAASTDGLLGDESLLDHVHPAIEGHQQIALMIAEQLVEAGFVKPDEEWQTRREEEFARHVTGLDPTYFFHGQERLERVQSWARGKIR